MIINNKPQKDIRDFSMNANGKSIFVRKLLQCLLVILLFASCNSTLELPDTTPTENLTTSTPNEIFGLEQIKEKGTITIGTAITKPFEYHDSQTNELIGLDVDIAEYLANDLGVNIQWIEIPFANLVPAIEDGKVDIAIAGMYITPERRDVVNFSTPYLQTGLIMAVHPDIHTNIHSVNDIESLNIGVKIGATGEMLADELDNNVAGIELVRADNAAVIFKIGAGNYQFEIY